MANIQTYLDDIEQAQKGEEVRWSIYHAIEAINNENITLNNNIRHSVENMMDSEIDSRIDENTVKFYHSYDDFGDDYVHITSSPTQAFLMQSDSMVLWWDVDTYNGYLKLLAKRLPNDSTAHIGYLYFLRTYDNKIVEVVIPQDATSGVYQYNEISIGSGGGGTTYSEGYGIDINANVISVDTDVIQDKLIVGDNIDITNGIISATDTTYEAGNNIDITNGVISAESSYLFEVTYVYSNSTWTCNRHILDLFRAIRDGSNRILSMYIDQGNGKTQVYGRYNVTANTYAYSAIAYDLFVFANNTLTSYTIVHSLTSGEEDPIQCTVNTMSYQPMLTAGTGIDITNGVISIDLANAEDNSF